MVQRKFCYRLWDSDQTFVESNTQTLHHAIEATGMRRPWKAQIKVMNHWEAIDPITLQNAIYEAQGAIAA